MGNISTYDQSVNEFQQVEKVKEELKRYTFYPEIFSFQQSISGNVLLPHDTHKYHDARHRAFNLDQRGYPFIIVQPKTTDDVVKTINFYQKYCYSTNESVNITLCIASGGHSSKCMITGSFVIDLKLMNEVSVDIENKLVTVGGGTYVKELDRALSSYNLAVPIETYPVVGVGGLSLGGGYGWLTRKHGLTVDYMEKIEIVLSNGMIITATDSNEYKELLWASKGGGGNFGVVTKFIFRCIPLPSRCFGGFVIYLTPTIDLAILLLQRYDNLVQNMGYDVSGSIRLSGGSVIMPTAWVHCGEEMKVEEITAFTEAKKLGGWLCPSLETSLRERSYHNDVQSMLTPFQISGHAYVTIFPIGSVNEFIPSKLFEELLQFCRTSLHYHLVKASVLLNTMGGGAIHADENNIRTCIPDVARKARYFAIIEVHWKLEYGKQGKETARNWAHKILDMMAPYKTVGMKYTYDEIQQETNDADFGFTPVVLRKLQDIKHKYDENNIFCNNLNILPLSSSSSSSSSSL